MIAKIPQRVLLDRLQTCHLNLRLCTATCREEHNCDAVPTDVTFFSNRYRFQECCASHKPLDAGSTQQHWPFPESHIGLGYAYILTHPGLPCIAWEHMWDERHTFIIKQLMSLRRRQDIHAGSNLEILCADRTMYVARIDNRCDVHWVDMPGSC